MQQTTTHKAHLIFLQMVKEQYESIRDALASGSAQNFDEYKHRTGIVQGLRMALDMMDEAHKTANGDK